MKKEKTFKLKLTDIIYGFPREDVTFFSIVYFYFLLITCERLQLCIIKSFNSQGNLKKKIEQNGLFSWVRERAERVDK